MSVIVSASIVFGSLFGGTLLGMWLRSVLPPSHLSPDAKDSVRVAMASVATMTALVLGLLVASTKSAYDTERNEVTQMASKIDYLDRVLANYGPAAAPSRAQLRTAVESALVRMWPEQKWRQTSQLEPGSAWSDDIPASIEKLSPENNVQRALQTQAMELANDLGQTRWLLYEQEESSISMPMLVIVIAWLAIIFISLGLFAPPNLTVIVAMMMAALSVSGAIFLILELDNPFGGVIKIPSKPMHNALEHLGKR